MSKAPSDNQYFGTEKTMKILFKLAPPVMLAQLIQSLYNIVDSFFIGKFSGYALTALSVIYPMQLLICAVAVGTGVGVNTVMARFYGQKRTSKAINTAGIGTVKFIYSHQCLRKPYYCCELVHIRFDFIFHHKAVCLNLGRI